MCLEGKLLDVMDLADWCSASISHVSLFAWPNHKTQKVRKSLHSVLADLFRVPVRFSQGNLEGKSEVKAGLFCWQASAEAFYFLIFSSSAVQIPDTRHTLACELLLCCSLGADNRGDIFWPWDNGDKVVLHPDVLVFSLWQGQQHLRWARERGCHGILQVPA